MVETCNGHYGEDCGGEPGCRLGGLQTQVTDECEGHKCRLIGSDPQIDVPLLARKRRKSLGEAMMHQREQKAVVERKVSPKSLPKFQRCRLKQCGQIVERVLSGLQAQGERHPANDQPDAEAPEDSEDDILPFFSHMLADSTKASIRLKVPPTNFFEYLNTLNR